MSSVSTINSLPTDPAGGGSVTGNIQMTATETNSVIDNMQKQLNSGNNAAIGGARPTVELSQNTIAELVSGLQTVSKNGNTSLPSRDIPINEARIATDEEIKPDFIPVAENDNYIDEDETNEDVINNYIAKEDSRIQAESIYDDLQVPIIVALLHFLLQIPAFKKMQRKIIPSIFGADGNMNIYGFIFNSVFLASSVFITRRIIQTISD
tara:strand:- start:11543 stop:12169 length:627 start_codon:yes stop_codon:yes gene_type:complete